MAKRSGRTQVCGIREARERLRQAKSHLEVANLVADTKDLDLEYASVAASVAILGGIAAADAACCAALKKTLPLRQPSGRREATRRDRAGRQEGGGSDAAVDQLLEVYAE